MTPNVLIGALSRDSDDAIKRDILAFSKNYERERYEAEAKLQRRMKALQFRWEALGHNSDEWQPFLRKSIGLPPLQIERKEE